MRLLALSIVFALSACGYKGSLYLEPSQPAPAHHAQGDLGKSESSSPSTTSHVNQ